MTRGRRLVQDFLLPALEDKKYGKLLEWIDRDKQVFGLVWSHKNASNWTFSDTIVFQDWDKLKGHYRPEVKGYFMQAKQRFRAALYKLDSVKKINVKHKHLNVYQLVDGKSEEKKKRGCEILGRSKRIIKKEENQRSIPTSVIRKNTSYIAKQSEEDSTHPSSPVNSSRSNMSEPDLTKKEMDKCYHEYMANQRRQALIHNTAKEMHHEKETSPSTSENVHNSSVLPKNLVTQETPLLAKQANLAYCPASQSPEISSEHWESPDVFVVETHNESAVYEKDDILDYVMNADTVSDGALNLSLKADDSEALSS
ncbi:IRF tryptophan pentad repeat domain-containing protein [Nephila pilipes]|uniref:IRF tryptophan pentad repeat domain-containing protein n=1 Tax=Nephila pilipes TaxID=299642 RepID=A0A8X6NH40_NEPPI|nr:IRF tryptophan pentad repeat domain-containing protein [Nephila pilipes]